MALDPNRWTLKTQEAVNTAIAAARSASNPEVTPDHLLLALLGEAALHGGRRQQMNRHRVDDLDGGHVGDVAGEVGGGVAHGAFPVVVRRGTTGPVVPQALHSC